MKIFNFSKKQNKKVSEKSLAVEVAGDYQLLYLLDNGNLPSEETFLEWIMKLQTLTDSEIVKLCSDKNTLGEFLSSSKTTVRENDTRDNTSTDLYYDKEYKVGIKASYDDKAFKTIKEGLVTALHRLNFKVDIVKNSNRFIKFYLKLILLNYDLEGVYDDYIKLFKDIYLLLYDNQKGTRMEYGGMLIGMVAPKDIRIIRQNDYKILETAFFRNNIGFGWYSLLGIVCFSMLSALIMLLFTNNYWSIKYPDVFITQYSLLWIIVFSFLLGIMPSIMLVFLKGFYRGYLTSGDNKFIQYTFVFFFGLLFIASSIPLISFLYFDLTMKIFELYTYSMLFVIVAAIYFGYK